MSDAIGSPVSSRSLHASPVSSLCLDGDEPVEPASSPPRPNDTDAFASHAAADAVEVVTSANASGMEEGIIKTEAAEEVTGGLTSHPAGLPNGTAARDLEYAVKCEEGGAGTTGIKEEPDKCGSQSVDREESKGKDNDEEEEDSKERERDAARRRDKEKERGRVKERDRKRRHSSSRSYSPKKRNTDKPHRRSSSPRRSRSRSPKHRGRSRSRSPRRGIGRSAYSPRRRSRSFTRRSRSRSNSRRSRSRSRTRTPPRHRSSYNHGSRAERGRIPPCVDMVNLLPSVRVALVQLYERSILKYTDLDVTCLDVLKTLTEREGLQALDDLAHINFAKVRNLPAFFVGICRKISQASFLPSMGGWGRERSRDRSRERERERGRVRDRVRDRLYSRDRERDRRPASPSSSGGYDPRTKRHTRDASPSNAGSRDSRREWWRDNDAPESRRSEHTSSWVPQTDDSRPPASPPRSSPAPKPHPNPPQQQAQQATHADPTTNSAPSHQPNEDASDSRPAQQAQHAQQAQQDSGSNGQFPPPPPMSPVTPTPEHTGAGTVPVSSELPLPPPPPLPFPPSSQGQVATDTSKPSPSLHDSLVPPHLVGQIPQNAQTSSAMPTLPYPSSAVKEEVHVTPRPSNPSATITGNQTAATPKPTHPHASTGVPSSSAPLSTTSAAANLQHMPRPIHESHSAQLRPASSSASDPPLNRVGTVWLADGTQLHGSSAPYRVDSASELPNSRSSAPYRDHHEPPHSASTAPLTYPHRHTSQFSSAPYTAAQAPRHAGPHISASHQNTSRQAPTYVVTTRTDLSDSRYYPNQPLQQVRLATTDLYGPSTASTTAPAIVSLSATQSSAPHSSVNSRGFALHSQVPIVDTLDHARLHVDGLERMHLSQDGRHIGLSNAAVDRLLDPRVNAPPHRIASSSMPSVWSPGSEPIPNTGPTAQPILAAPTAAASSQYFVNGVSTSGAQHHPPHQQQYHMARTHPGAPQEVILFAPTSTNNLLHPSSSTMHYNSATAGPASNANPTGSFPAGVGMGAPSGPQPLPSLTSSGLDSQPQATSMLRNAVMEVVKELMKPAWKSQRLSREDFKTIARKAVDKVLLTVPKGMPIDTPNAVTEFLSESRKEKIKRLVDGYLHKYNLTHAAGMQLTAAPDAGPHVAPVSHTPAMVM